MLTIDSHLLGYAAGFLTTISFLPQALHTLKTRDTASLSLGMYSLFTGGVLCWLLYGIQLKDSAIIISNAVTLCLAATILTIKISHAFTNKDKDL